MIIKSNCVRVSVLSLSFFRCLSFDFHVNNHENNLRKEEINEIMKTIRLGDNEEETIAILLSLQYNN